MQIQRFDFLLVAGTCNFFLLFFFFSSKGIASSVIYVIKLYMHQIALVAAEI